MLHVLYLILLNLRYNFNFPSKHLTLFAKKNQVRFTVDKTQKLNNLSKTQSFQGFLIIIHLLHVCNHFGGWERRENLIVSAPNNFTVQWFLHFFESEGKCGRF